MERCSSERFRSPIKPSPWGTIRPWFSSRLRHFILESVQLELDGKNFHTDALPSWEELPGQPESLSLAHQHVEPGEHRVDVRVLMRASAAPFGVFGVYFHPYRFTLHTAHLFEMPTHEFIGLSLAIYERAQPTIPIEERPAIECINIHGF